MRALAIIAVLALAACNPLEVANIATKRAAKVVATSVFAQKLPAPAAEAAAECIVDAASPEELRALAADIGVTPGTQTLANVSALALRPSAVNCMAAGALPAMMGGL